MEVTRRYRDVGVLVGCLAARSQSCGDSPGPEPSSFGLHGAVAPYQRHGSLCGVEFRELRQNFMIGG